MSFADADIDLVDKGYTLIEGINNNPLDLAKSNGSGKSSIGEAIVWALTGETIRGTKSIVNQYISNGAYVTIRFSIDNNDYEITRYKDDPKYGTNLKLYINTVDKSGKGIRDTEKILAQYLPDLTSSLLGSVIILGQGLPQRFTNNTPSGRKEVLEKLSRSDFMIQDLKEKLSDRKVYLSAEARKYDDYILEAESKLAIYTEQAQNSSKELQELESKDFITDISQALNKVNLLSASLQEQENLQRDTKLSIDAASKSIEDSTLNIEKKKLEIAAQYAEQLDSLSKEIFAIEYEITTLTKQINDYKSIKDVCPTCGQRLPEVHKVDTTELEEKLASLQEAHTTKSNERNVLIQQREARVNEQIAVFTEAIKESKDLLTALQPKFTEFSNTVSAYSLQLDNAKKEHQKLVLQQEQQQATIDKLKASISSINTSIEQLETEILYNKNERGINNNRLEIVNKLLTVATRDFRGYLLSEVITFIEQKAKEYAQIIFDHNNIDFKLEGNNININYCNKPYENLSGGEKQKIDIIIQFSIRDMLTKFLGFSSNILILDEIADNLDSVGVEKVLNLISTNLTDIESIFIISHHSNELLIPYDNIITIIKDENQLSRLL